MPEAWAAYAAPVTVPDRQWFEHAHFPGNAVFPPLLAYEESAIAYWKCPDDWAGFSRCRLWLRGAATDASMPITVGVNAGTCNEVYTTHNQTAGLTPALVINEYECVDITVALATVLAAIDDCDVVEFWVTNMDDSNSLYYVGVEIVEA